MHVNKIGFASSENLSISKLFLIKLSTKQLINRRARLKKVIRQQCFLNIKDRVTLLETGAISFLTNNVDKRCSLSLAGK